jgi:hypothetical protein
MTYIILYRYCNIEKKIVAFLPWMTLGILTLCWRQVNLPEHWTVDAGGSHQFSYWHQPSSCKPLFCHPTSSMQWTNHVFTFEMPRGSNMYCSMYMSGWDRHKAPFENWNDTKRLCIWQCDEEIVSHHIEYPLSLLIFFFSNMHKNCMLFQYRRENRVRRVDHPPWKQKTKEMKKENQTRHATKVILQARLGPMLC